MPIVRNTGGLRDTVVDFGDWEGFGIRFENATVWDITYSVGRAIDLYFNKEKLLKGMTEHMMQIDHSWEASASQYISLYRSII